MKFISKLPFDNSDGDALKTLALSVGVLIASGCLSYLTVLGRVFFHAWTAPIQDTADIYLLFGKKLTFERPDADYTARLERLLELAPQQTIILGGKTGKAVYSEAQAGFDYLCSRGYPGEFLHLEQDSLNTLENLKNARQLLEGRNAEYALFISSRYHLARCGMLARSLGIPYRLCAAESRFKPTPSNLLRVLAEAFYLHWFLSGKYWAKITANRKMLEKIS